MNIHPEEKYASKFQEDTTTTSSDDEIRRETDWRAVWIAGVITFIAGLENTVVGMSEWPYMYTIDDDATSQYFGVVSAFAKCGHGLGAILYAYWSYKAGANKPALIFGRIMAFAACVLYLSVEVFPVGRRHVMAFCYICFGLASSSSTVLRTYIASKSLPADRTKAYSSIVVANMLAIVIGPLCQLCFTGIKYPGWEIIPSKLRVHIYSAPVWVATATNFFSLAIICFVFDDLPKKKKVESESEPFCVGRLKERLVALCSLELPWSIVSLCWMERMIANLAVATLLTMVSPMMMSTFGWDGGQTVQATSLCMGVVGVLSILVGVLFMFTPVGRIISSRMSFLISLAISMCMYIFSYPYDFLNEEIPPFNQTTKAGCDPSAYSWCVTSHATSPWVFLPIVVFVMGIGVPTAAVSIDGIYSKVLGNIDQSVMQGAIVVAEDIVQILGPIYAASMFTYTGQGPLWISNGVITFLGIGLWIVSYRSLKPYC